MQSYLLNQQTLLTRWIGKCHSAKYNISVHLPLAYSSTRIEKPTELFEGGQMLWSEEDQGDPLAMPMYALATIPFIDQLSDIQYVIQVWYANDTSTAQSRRKQCGIGRAKQLIIHYYLYPTHIQ